MMRLGKQFQNMPVTSLQLGGAVARLGKPIINPHKLQIAGFYCERPDVREPSAILVQDIRQVIHNTALIDNEDEIALVAGLLRLQDLIQINFQLIGKPVVTASKQKLGKVVDYAVDEQSFLIRKLHAKQPLWRNLLMANLVIDRSQILEVTDSRIVVKDAVVTDKVPAEAVVEAPAV